MSGPRLLFAAVLAAALAPGAAAEGGEASGAEERAWDFSLAAYAYAVPEDRDYVQPTFIADRGRLHLEARWSYEDLDTGSAWAGANWSFGKTTTLDLTVMGGVVVGLVDGFAPGLELSVARGGLELYLEAEHLVATSDSEDDFTYTWTELTYSPIDWFRFGALDQRTWLDEGGPEIEIGPVLGFVAGDADIVVHAAFPEDGDPTWLLGLTWSF